MTWHELLAQLGLLQHGNGNPEILGVALDSRQVQPGFVFVAVQGIAMPGRAPLDGHDFVAAALERGAVAVVGSQDLRLGVPYLRVPNPRAVCADIASVLCNHPEQELSVVGVTGSKGKSTVVALVHHILEHSGFSVARMSTVGVRFAGQDEHLPGHFTTPESPQVYELLRRFRGAGCTHAVMEVSSHALELERVRGIRFAVGAWVNFFADDHIDFHGSEGAYFAAKQQLLARSDFCVLNSDDPRYPQIDAPHWAFGAHGDWRVLHSAESAAGTELELASPLGNAVVFVPMIGAFNAQNALAAMAVCAKLGVGLPSVAKALQAFPGVPGRMQIVQAVPFRVINDFAHTGASLEAALQTLRPTTQGRLIVLIGAAGQRDPNRRTGIAEVAARLADETVFTEEDSRTEPTSDILGVMQAAFLAAGGQHCRAIEERREAMRCVLALAQPGDTVLLAGKGHERTLERGTAFLPWNETEIAKELLRDLQERS